VLEALLRLIPALLRHLVAYGDLLADEAADRGRELRRQLLSLALMAASGVVATLMGCAWVIAATWDGPHRLQAVGALFAGFVLITLGAVWSLLHRAGPLRPQPFERLQAEWRKDLGVLSARFPSLAGIEEASRAD